MIDIHHVRKYGFTEKPNFYYLFTSDDTFNK